MKLRKLNFMFSLKGKLTKIVITVRALVYEEGGLIHIHDPNREICGTGDTYSTARHNFRHWLFVNIKETLTDE